MGELILNRKDQQGEYRNNYDQIDYWREHRIEILTKIKFSNKNSVPVITRKGVHQGARKFRNPDGIYNWLCNIIT